METKPNVEESFSETHPHLTTLTAPTTTTMLDITSYSQGTAAAVTSFPLDLHGAAQQTQYYSDLDWQHGAPVPDSSHGHFYGFTDRPDLASVQLYHTFPAAVPPTDLYASSPALWTHPPPSLVEDSHHATALASQRYLPSLSRTSGSSGSSSSSSSSTSPSSSGSGKPKRRRVQSVTQRKAANVRERRRMFHLNTAFDELRKRLPAFNYEKRLSRIETLRLAMTYIGFMKDVSMGQDPRKVKLRPGCSDAGSDLAQLDMESCTSEDPHHEDVES